MYHDLTDDFKSRDYVIAITLKDGDYYGNIFYEYTSGGYGLSVSTMEDILQFIEELNCEEINELNEEGLLNNNIALRADINGLNIHFELLTQHKLTKDYQLLRSTKSSLMLTLSKSDIFASVCKFGCEVFVHHLLTVTGSLPSCSASHLFV